MTTPQNKLRNIAIIAHVDHGKTTLVDGLLKQAHTFQAHQSIMHQTSIMDSMDLERERGVTILAKNTAVFYHEYKINILDTPGHADFSGEVERVLHMADGCILLVDAAEGVLSQTRYVLSLALARHLKPIVVINKIDRKDQRIKEVEDEISNLFLDLAQDADQLEFPILYAIGRDGVAGRSFTEQPDHTCRVDNSGDLEPLFETIISQVPAPHGDTDAPFQMLVAALDSDPHKGRFLIGRVHQGKLSQGDPVVIMRNDVLTFKSRAEYVFTFKGLERLPAPHISAGDIVSISGPQEAHIGDTVCNPEYPHSLPTLEIAEPTIQIQILVSDSPLAGQESEFNTSRQLKERLDKEIQNNISLKITPGPSSESFTIAGRGELHLSILIETMRREGYEFSVARPQVIFKQIDGVTQEPFELITIDVPAEHQGTVITAMGQRKASLVDMQTHPTGIRLQYHLATRHFLGLRSELLQQTSGLSVIHSQVMGYQPKSADLEQNRNGVIVAIEPGKALAYSLENVQQRAITFIEPGIIVYTGMIVGLNSRREDMYMNVTKGKKLTNTRAASADDMITLDPPRKMSLEQCLTFLAEDELLEVTPQNLRLRKRSLSRK